MQKSKLNVAILNHLSGEETEEEGIAFLAWYNSAEENKIFYDKVKALWDVPNADVPITFRGKFTPKKILRFISNKVIGSFIGFAVAFSITRYFTHEVLERRNVKNLFGIIKRKKYVVEDMPEWLQSLIAIVVGFVVLEFINYLFESKKHILLWNYLKKAIHPKS